MGWSHLGKICGLFDAAPDGVLTVRIVNRLSKTFGKDGALSARRVSEEFTDRSRGQPTSSAVEHWS